MSLRLQNPETKGDISGEFNFKYSLEIKYEDIGTISGIVARTSTRSRMPIPVKCVWKRYINGRIYVVQGVSGKEYLLSVYQPTCEDIGAHIQCEASPIDTSEYAGVAIGSLGPLVLDSGLRKNLEFILSSGSSKFTLYHSADLLDHTKPNNEALIEISKDMIKLEVLQRDGSLDGANSFVTSFSVDYPKIILHPNDNKKLIFILNEGCPSVNGIEELEYDKKMSVECLTRQSRDLIVLAIRCFSVRNYIIHSQSIESLFASESIKNNLDTMIDLEMALREVSILAMSNFSLSREKNKLRKELKNMEKEMEETIEAYKGLVSYHTSPAAERELQEEIDELKHELDMAISNKKRIRRKYESATEQNSELAKQNKKLLKKVESLEIQLSEEQQRIFNEECNSNEELTNEINTLRSSLEKQSQKYVRAKSKASSSKSLREKLNLLISSNEKLEQENKALTDQVCNIESDYSKLKQENEALLGQRVIFSKKIETLQNELSSCLTEKETLSVELQTALSDLSLLRESHEESKEESASQHLVQQLEEANTEIKKYKSECDSLSAQLSRAQAQLRRREPILK